mmetsp:Transcript_17351/g.37298  ORF Transcript_17351/g.37298 Transcript_17351/m.37298 type:complete len:234 (-) Transcript_17351:584-1285(-)
MERLVEQNTRPFRWAVMPHALSWYQCRLLNSIGKHITIPEPTSQRHSNISFTASRRQIRQIRVALPRLRVPNFKRSDGITLVAIRARGFTHAARLVAAPPRRRRRRATRSSGRSWRGAPRTSRGCCRARARGCCHARGCHHALRHARRRGHRPHAPCSTRRSWRDALVSSHGRPRLRGRGHGRGLHDHDRRRHGGDRDRGHRRHGGGRGRGHSHGDDDAPRALAPHVRARAWR